MIFGTIWPFGHGHNFLSPIKVLHLDVPEKEWCILLGLVDPLPLGLFVFFLVRFIPQFKHRYGRLQVPPNPATPYPGTLYPNIK